MPNADLTVLAPNLHISPNGQYAEKKKNKRNYTVMPAQHKVGYHQTRSAYLALRCTCKRKNEKIRAPGQKIL
jgi:hypothetical protein